MKILYLDCGMGAAGDMLGAALLELLPERGAFVEKLNALSLPGVRFAAEPSVKCGIRGTHLNVLCGGRAEGEEDPEHGHVHEHRGIDGIRDVADALAVPEKVRRDILAVFDILADAESFVHGVPVSEIHFHEVGTMDAIADITAACMLLHTIAPDKIVASPVRTGYGHVKCAHGILPVPAPATARILQGIPAYAGDIESELCTPTGAALLKYFVSEFKEMPLMRTTATGYGMGRRDFEYANCVRASLGESEDGADCVLELSFNVDDMTAEEIGFAAERLFAAGAREVFTVPAGMKKSRPGTLFVVICDEGQREEIVRLIFRHTETIGIRESKKNRYVLSRETEEVDTPLGRVRRKHSYGYGADRRKYEYEDVAALAREKGIGFREALDLLE